MPMARPPSTGSGPPSTAGSSSSSPLAPTFRCATTAPARNRRDKNATKLLSDSPQLVKVMDWWKQMVADGLALNTGRPTANAQTAFKAGRIAITLESTRLLGGALNGSRVQVGTGFYPRSEASSAGGPAVGGASLWIMNDHPA